MRASFGVFEHIMAQSLLLAKVTFHLRCSEPIRPSVPISSGASLMPARFVYSFMIEWTS